MPGTVNGLYKTIVQRASGNNKRRLHRAREKRPVVGTGFRHPLAKNREMRAREVSKTLASNVVLLGVPSGEPAQPARLDDLFLKTLGGAHAIAHEPKRAQSHIIWKAAGGLSHVVHRVLHAVIEHLAVEEFPETPRNEGS